ncbi:hypothetical protein GCM10023178_59510 [Actinomadura luteofluorescens]
MPPIPVDMKGLTNLLTVLVAALIGGVVGSLVLVVSMAGDIYGQEVAAVVMVGGAAGALCAVIASAFIVFFGKTAFYSALVVGIALLGNGAYQFALGHDGTAIAFGIGLACFAGVLADSVARSGGTVRAAGTVAPQGQNSKSSGGASQK